MFLTFGSVLFFFFSFSFTSPFCMGNNWLMSSWITLNCLSCWNKSLFRQGKGHLNKSIWTVSFVENHIRNELTYCLHVYSISDPATSQCLDKEDEVFCSVFDLVWSLIFHNYIITKHPTDCRNSYVCVFFFFCFENIKTFWWSISCVNKVQVCNSCYCLPKITVSNIFLLICSTYCQSNI